MNTAIGYKIKSLRLQNHISQQDLCGNFMNRVVLSRIENNKIIKYICLCNYGSNRMSFVIYNNLAYLYLKTGEYNKAVQLLEAFFNEHDDMLFIDVAASMYLTLNICCCNTGDYSKSIKYIKKAIYLYLYKEKYLEAGECYLNYINSLRYSGNFEEALAVLNQCKKNYEQYSDLYQRFLVQELILKFNMKDFQGVINEAKTINLKNLSMRNRYDCFFMIGHSCFAVNDYKKAHEYLIKCEKFYSSSN